MWRSVLSADKHPTGRAYRVYQDRDVPGLGVPGLHTLQDGGGEAGIIRIRLKIPVRDEARGPHEETLTMLKTMCAAPARLATLSRS